MNNLNKKITNEKVLDIEREERKLMGVMSRRDSKSGYGTSWDVEDF